MADENSILSDITDQDVIFLSSPSPNTILLKVNFSQRYYLGDPDHHILWLGNCFYYLAFNIRRNKFYRIGGFDKLDLDEFFDDFETVDYKLINPEYSRKSKIDFYCLKEYSETPVKRRLKKPPCLPLCSEELGTSLVIPQKEN